jgi:hypothetical protein
MACAPCSKRRAAAEAAGSAQPSTYQVRVGDRQVYESHNKQAAEGVAEKFDSSELTAPDGTVMYWRQKQWTDIAPTGSTTL